MENDHTFYVGEFLASILFRSGDQLKENFPPYYRQSKLALSVRNTKYNPINIAYNLFGSLVLWNSYPEIQIHAIYLK